MNLWMLTYLLTAVFYDWRDFRIPNWLNGAAAAVMLGFCLQRGFDSSLAASLLSSGISLLSSLHMLS